ncbi:STM4015 family protein [Streptomyces sp. NPDC090994]|uniref:STM4015 family protein n=1 Tax=Streptomyces sp. NPDC090994 TaxID=3365969 RepID=UPI0038185661
MVFSDTLNEQYHLPVVDFPGVGQEAGLPAAEEVAWRISAGGSYDEVKWPDAFARFCSTVDADRVRALVVGAWDSPTRYGPDEVIDALLAARDRLPALRALFLGDMDFMTSELSWIKQTDVTPLLTAFPELEEFGVRGSDGLEWHVARHDRLRRLTVESGGLPAAVVRGIAASELPALEHLDVWLGTSWYGADSEPADVAPILEGSRLPRLRHLALRDSEIQDAIAVAAASAPVVARLEVLDLSMGTLGDEGAAALLAGQPLTHLKKLDLHHHYIGEELQERIRRTLAVEGVDVDLSEDRTEDDKNEDGTVARFVAAGE